MLILNRIMKTINVLSTIMLSIGIILFLIEVVLGFIPINNPLMSISMTWISFFGLYVGSVLIFFILGSIEIIIGYYKKHRIIWSYMLPLAITLLFIPIIGLLGGSIYSQLQERQFNQHFPEFERMTDDIKNQRIKPQADSFYETPLDLPANGAIVDENEDGILIIRYLTGGYGPFSVGGHLYISNDNPQKAHYTQYRLKKIKPYWYKWS